MTGVHLTGLPVLDRYPDVAIELGPEVLDLRFTGEGVEHGVQVPLHLLGAEDDEAAAIDVAAKLKELGYEVTLCT
jgi:hypothetical protein